MLDGLADYSSQRAACARDRQRGAPADTATNPTPSTAFLDESGITIDPTAVDSRPVTYSHIHGDWYQSAGIGESENAHYQRVVDDLKQHGVVLKRRGQKKTRTWLGVGETP